ncbi:MAG: hypothetical protein WCO45_14720 [Pseudanabaena sp. ELA607]
MIHLAELLRVANPSHTLDFTNSHDRPYYIDFSGVRGDAVVLRMRRSIALSANKPTCHLISGYSGCGKTTELWRLRHELEAQGFMVVYIESDAFLELQDVTVYEVWLMVIYQWLKQMERSGIRGEYVYLSNLVQNLENWLHIAVPTGVDILSRHLGHLVMALRENAELRQSLRNYAESQFKSISRTVCEEAATLTNERLRHLGKKGLVILVDNLDRMGSAKQAEELFYQNADLLQTFPCHLVYTVPTVLRPEADLIRSKFRNGSYHFLPMVRLWHSDYTPDLAGFAKMQELILSRAFPNIATTQRLEQMPLLFQQRSILFYLCLYSGGNLRLCLRLFHACLQYQEPPLHLAWLQAIQVRDQQLLLDSLSIEEQKYLEQMDKHPKDLSINVLVSLCQRQLIAEYREAQQHWFLPRLKFPQSALDALEVLSTS